MNQVEEYLRDQPDHLSILGLAVRDLILSLHPAISERLVYDIPFFYKHKRLFYLTMREDDVQLGFCSGWKLDDPYNLLQGEHLKFVRHYHIHSFTDLSHPGLKMLLDSAMENDA